MDLREKGVRGPDPLLDRPRLRDAERHDVAQERELAAHGLARREGDDRERERALGREARGAARLGVDDESRGVAETCGLRVADVDFMRGYVSPQVQYPAEPLKSDISRTPVPIPESLAMACLLTSPGCWPRSGTTTSGTFSPAS